MKGEPLEGFQTALGHLSAPEESPLLIFTYLGSVDLRVLFDW